MKIIKREQFIILEIEERETKDVIAALNKKYEDFKSDNLVLNILKVSTLSPQELQSLTQLAQKHKNNGKSFVIVSALHHEEIPEALENAPSLREAEDIVNMEEIERDLGF